MNLEIKIDAIKKIIIDNENADGDYWYYTGNELIHQILDIFDESEWQFLNIKLNNFDEQERYQFCCTLLDYDTSRIVQVVDIYEIFFTQYLLLSSENADWIMQDIMYVANIRQPKLDLLQKLLQKIETLKSYDKTNWKEDDFLWAEDIINKVIEKYHH